MDVVEEKTKDSLTTWGLPVGYENILTGSMRRCVER